MSARQSDGNFSLLKWRILSARSLCLIYPDIQITEWEHNEEEIVIIIEVTRTSTFILTSTAINECVQHQHTCSIAKNESKRER